MFCELLNNFSPIPLEFIVAAPHFHDDDTYGERVVTCYELEYNTTGTGYVIVDGIQVPATANTLHFRRPGMVVEGIGIYSSHYFEFHFNEQKDIIEELNVMPVVYYLHDYSEIQEIFETVFNEYYEDTTTRLLTFKINVMKIFEFMINDWYNNTQNASLSAGATDNIKRSMTYMQKHYDAQLTIQTLADVAGYSIYHYSRLFKDVTQWTPIQYLNRLRINHARQMLAETDLTTDEVLFACGFNSYTYFFRIFKEQTGISPAQFKRQHRHGPKGRRN